MYGLSVDDTSYHIAIIDDESGEREKLRSLIAHYFDQYLNKVYEICMYEDGEEIAAGIWAAGKYFDLFFWMWSWKKSRQESIWHTKSAVSIWSR